MGVPTLRVEQPDQAENTVTLMLSHTDLTPGRAFFERHHHYLMSGDVDGLIAHSYHPDAVLIRFNVIVHGHGELIPYYRDYVKNVLGGRLDIKSVDNFTETADSIFYEGTALTSTEELRTYNVLIMRDGKITHHFSGIRSRMPITQRKEADVPMSNAPLTDAEVREMVLAWYHSLDIHAPHVDFQL